MKKITLILFLFIGLKAFSQKETLYLFIEKPFFRYSTIENIKTGFIINSQDKRFVCDYYKFGILNYLGWDENGEDIYLNLKELRKEIKIDSIQYKTIKILKKDKEWWQIHNELSLYKKIFLLEKRETKFNVSTGKFDFGYFISPMIYEGTRKNIVPTSL